MNCQVRNNLYILSLIFCAISFNVDNTIVTVILEPEFLQDDIMIELCFLVFVNLILKFHFPSTLDSGQDNILKGYKLSAMNISMFLGLPFDMNVLN